MTLTTDVMVTGSRRWTDRETIAGAMHSFADKLFYYNVRLIHGGAKGADTIAAEIAKEKGWPVVCVPAEWDKYGKAAGSLRNQKMLDDYRPRLVLAFPTEDSVGTWDAIRRSVAARVMVFIFPGKGDAK